jgi:hypothetical protein
MKKYAYNPNSIQKYLEKAKIATLPQLKSVLGTATTMTVFRALKKLSYHSSCSHNGTFYTLDSVVDFNYEGLWICRSVLFSIFGTLLNTVQALVEKSKSGKSRSELNAMLATETKETLLKLTRKNRLFREKVGGCYVYFSINEQNRRRQILMRTQVGISAEGTKVLAHELKAAIVLFYSLLDEQQRRLYAGLESIRLGQGGDEKISQLLNIDSDTVARGRKDLLSEEVSTHRIRKQGGGRTSIKKNS